MIGSFFITLRTVFLNLIDIDSKTLDRNFPMKFSSHHYNVEKQEKPLK
jgi:hypothetical protein